MKVFSYRFVDPVVRTDTVDGRRFYEGDTVQIAHIEILPGGVLEKHETPVDAVLYVLQGTAKVIIDNQEQVVQEQVVQQDELVEFPKNTPHEVINISQKKLRVLVIRHK